MSRMSRLSGALALVLSFGGAGIADAAIIDFDSLGLAGSTYFSGVFMEDGFTLDFVDYFYGTGSDSTAPFEVEREVFSDGILTVTASGGGTFTFESVDWQLEYGELAFISLEGFLGAASVGTDTFDTDSTAYMTFGASVLSGATIDRLVIRADRDDFDGGALDTLVLGDGRVPLPTTLALFGLGLAGLGVSRKRAR